MKRVFIIVSCLLVTYASIMATPVTKELKEGDKLTLNLELEFTDNAKEEGEFISWELVGDWDKFEYVFSQGNVIGNIYTIKSTEYQDFVGGENGIAITIKGKSDTEDAIYNLSMKITDVSDGLSISKEEFDLELDIHYILPPPRPMWEVMLIVFGILLALVLIAVIILKITARFPGGILQLGRDEISLKGKSRVSIKEELNKLNITLKDDCDVIFVKKRFGRFQGPCIKEIHNCALERDGIYVYKGTILLPEEELRGLEDTNGNEIIIRYC